MNKINELLIKTKGWKQCSSPRWFNEYQLRRKVGFPATFLLKGKTFKYKAFKQSKEEQGNTLTTIYQFYKKRRSGLHTKGD